MNIEIASINAENFEKTILGSSIPTALDFYSDTCVHCEALAPKVQKMAEKYVNKMNFYRIKRNGNKAIFNRYGVRSTPTIIFFNGGQELERKLVGNVSLCKLEQEIRRIIGAGPEDTLLKKEEYDVVIIGGGPAGLTAAIYTSRAGLSTLIIEEGAIGGQAASTYQVSNYPGFAGGIIGKELTENMCRQAEYFGAKIEIAKGIRGLSLKGRIKSIVTEDTEYLAKTVIIATGSESISLPAEGEDKYRGKGIHYCAVCDGAIYKDKEIVVIGGGNSALQEALYLTRFAKHITIIHQFDHFQAPKIVREEVLNNPNISVIWDCEVRKVNGMEFLQSLDIENIKTGEKRTVVCDGVFVYIGLKPETGFLGRQIRKTTKGYIITNENMQTNLAGVFAAGDVREKQVRQITTAVSDGTVAALSAERYILSIK